MTYIPMGLPDIPPPVEPHAHGGWAHNSLVLEAKRAILALTLILAGVGLILLLCGYILALSGRSRLADGLASYLFPGIFVVFFPVAILTGPRRMDFWKSNLGGCPRWMRRTLAGLVAFGILNFLYFVALSGRRPLPPLFLGGFGHMLALCGTAFALSYSALSQLRKEAVSASLHVTSPPNRIL